MGASGAGAIVLTGLGNAVALFLALLGGEDGAGDETQSAGNGGGERELIEGQIS